MSKSADVLNACSTNVCSELTEDQTARSGTIQSLRVVVRSSRSAGRNLTSDWDEYSRIHLAANKHISQEIFATKKLTSLFLAAPPSRATCFLVSLPRLPRDNVGTVYLPPDLLSFLHISLMTMADPPGLLSLSYDSLMSMAIHRDLLSLPHDNGRPC
jgi:hypothetical protein